MPPIPVILRFPLRGLPPVGLVTALALSPVALRAQETKPAQTPPAEADIIELSPFQVTASTDEGYAARDTLAGSRLKTDLNDVPSQISVMTSEFLKDIASVSIDDAYRYSANVENSSEYQSATLGGGDFNGGVINTFNTNRVRGLTTPGRSHDFFITNTPGDTYNSSRVTFSSGPNSILFGNGNPAGIVDNSFKQANLRRDSATVQIRTDNNSTLRGSLDFNDVIKKDVLAIRVDAVRADSKEWRDPAEENDKRIYGTITFHPFRNTSIRAYAEDAHIDRTVARNTLVGDSVTPWIAANRPSFNNGLVGTTPNPASTDPVFQRDTATQRVVLLGQTASNAFLAWGAGTGGGSAPYSGLTKGPGAQPYQTGTDVFTYSLLDDSISPRDVSINGNGTRNIVDSTIKGVILEQRLLPNLFLEAGINQEHLVNPVTDYVRGIQSAIRADANLYLPDRVTLNPNYGKYYVEGNGRGRLWLRDSREFRVMVAYELDLRKYSKWLGHHRFAAMYQRVHQIGAGQEMATRVVPAGATGQAAINAYGTAGQAVLYRYYLSNPADPSTGSDYYFKLPFDAAGPVTLPDGSTAWTINNPYGGTSNEAVTHDLLEGKLFAMNNFFLNDRLVTTFGWRNDHTRSATSQTANLAGTAYQSILDTPVSSDWSKYDSGNTFTGGAVLHVFPWVSLFYNKSSTWNAPRSASHNPDDSIIGGSIGDGIDYGFTMRLLDDRISLRVDRYENTSGPDISSYRTRLVPDIVYIERTLAEAAQAGTIASYTPPAGFDPFQDNVYYYDVVSDQVSKGTEFEVTANLTPNWRLAINGAHATVAESNIATDWINLVANRVSVWAQAENDHPGLSGPTSLPGKIDTISNRALGIIQTINEIKQAEGRRSEQQRQWRVNVLTRYKFSEGALRGVLVGGGYRWRSKGAIGYEASDATVTNEYTFPGIPDQIVVPSLDHPVYSGSIGDLEAFIGYNRPLFNRKVKWQIQLNVRNLLDKDNLLGQRANTGGDTVVYTVPTPRTFVLTNTFSF